MGHLDPIGVTRQDDTITIDLAKFDPDTVDLSKLDLSNGPDKFNYDTSNIDTTIFKQDLSKNDIICINKNLNFISNCLKDSYSLKTYEEHPGFYRQVIKDYMYLKLIQKIGNADSNKFMEGIYLHSQELLKENKMKRIIMESEAKEQNKPSRSDQKKEIILKQPVDKPKPILLFSTNQTERDFAIEKALTDMYTCNSKWKDSKQKINELVQKIFQADFTSQEKLDKILAINNKFRTEAMSDPGRYRPDLKHAIERTRTLYQWATKLRDQFNLDEDWVQAGMKRLGITKGNFTASLDKLLNNPFVNDEIRGNSPSVDAIVDGNTQTGRSAYDTNKIVEHFEEFTRANAMLNSIHGRLKEGIPVREIPRQINGQKRVATSGNNMNCLIYALLKVSKPDFNMNDNRWLASSIRNDLKIKMNGRVQSESEKVEGKLDDLEMQALRDRYHAVNNGEMLNLGSYDGQELINYLRESRVMVHNRGVLVYQLKEGKILCDDHPFPSSQDTSSQEKPYTLFLQEDYHFEAMLPVEDNKTINDDKNT